jgi:hypothetical protein
MNQDSITVTVDAGQSILTATLRGADLSPGHDPEGTLYGKRFQDIEWCSSLAHTNLLLCGEGRTRNVDGGQAGGRVKGARGEVPTTPALNGLSRGLSGNMAPMSVDGILSGIMISCNEATWSQNCASNSGGVGTMPLPCHRVAVTSRSPLRCPQKAISSELSSIWLFMSRQF